MGTIALPATIPPLRGGDQVYFWGRGFLSEGIEHTTGGASHMATVVDPLMPLPDGSRQKELYIIESTIWQGKDGVQLNKLSERVATYDAGGAIALAYLSDRIRAFLDWAQFWHAGLSRLGDHYNKLELAAFLANLALPGALHFSAPDKDSEVCSELGAMMLRAGGIPGLDPYCTPPHRLWTMRLFREYVPILGQVPVEDFNTV